MATLLIVEDNKNTNEAICEYLKQAGHKVIPAYDGAKALQIFEQGCQYCMKSEKQVVHLS